MLHRKFGSRRIIDILSRLGSCSSYREATLYEECMLLSEPVTLNKEIFAQFVFDNADFNINTIDGKNTFHSMGGVYQLSLRPVSYTHLDVYKRQE